MEGFQDVEIFGFGSRHWTGQDQFGIQLSQGQPKRYIHTDGHEHSTVTKTDTPEHG